MPPAYISHRLSIRWIPEEAREPTNTVVLTGARTGVFLDVRFLKDNKNLDWAFAGYRYTDPNVPDAAKFKHHIDSRTDSDDVEDGGIFTKLPDGTTLEVGEMMNPQSGRIASYEELWRDDEAEVTDTVLFVKNMEGTTWRAYVGTWQLALGRGKDGRFWAWQAERCGEDWKTRALTQDGIMKLLPTEDQELATWVEGATVKWNAEEWIVLQRAM